MTEPCTYQDELFRKLGKTYFLLIQSCRHGEEAFETKYPLPYIRAKLMRIIDETLEALTEIGPYLELNNNVTED
jgi:hypothetical protein